MALILQTLLADRYCILAELGRGGMGAVYQARDESLGVEVAIKENLFVSPDFADAFEREARLLASLRHASLPRVTDHFVLRGQGQYLVMDFIAGEDLRQRLLRNGKPLPEDEVVRWARHILDALKYLHVRDKPIIHRDIKPANIKLTADGRAVLVDFGLAKIHDAARDTATGMKALTPGFSPPEQYGAGRTGPRSDIYALGATLYNLMAGQSPEDALQRALGQVTLIPLEALNPQVSPRLSAVVERCLAIKPEHRYADAAEVLEALDPAHHHLRTTPPRQVQVASPALPAPALPRPILPARVSHAPVSPAPAPTPAARRAPPPLPPRRRGWLTATALLALLVLGIGGGMAVVFGYAYLRPMLAGLGAAVPATVTAAPAPTTGTAPPADTGAASTAEPATGVVATAAATEPPPAEASSTTAPTEAATAPPTAPPPTDAAPVPTFVGGGQGQIAFASERDGLPQIYVMGVDGADLTRLTQEPEGACQPAWSPDGTQLLFVTPCAGKAERYPSSAIYVMNADGSQIRPFIAILGGAYEPDWSAAGVVFTHIDGGRPQIYLANSEGGGLQRLSATNSGDSQPAWAPDGARLAFRNFSRSGQMTIYWMLPDGNFARGGSNPEAISRGVEAGSPAWAPDDTAVVYVVGSQLILIDWTARGFGAQVLSAEGPNADPAWSPDARWLVFESWRDGAQHDLYRMPATGGSLARLTNDAALDYQPAWRP